MALFFSIISACGKEKSHSRPLPPTILAASRSLPRRLREGSSLLIGLRGVMVLIIAIMAIIAIVIVGGGGDDDIVGSSTTTTMLLAGNSRC